MKIEAPRRKSRIKFGEVGVCPQRTEAKRALKEALEQVVDYTSNPRF